jgi:hypothetical protein
MDSIAIKNGYYIPLLYPLIHILTGDTFLATIVVLKAFPANYFYWYADHYDYWEGYNWVKQFVHLTDSGHFVSFFYWITPDYLPLAFTIHFVITAGFWYGKAVFNMKDRDRLYLPELDLKFQEIWSTANHGVPLLLLAYHIRTNDQCYPFTYRELENAYLWMYGWLFLIYIPWRVFTGDIVYDPLSFETPKKSALFFSSIHVIVLLGHLTGYLLSRC